MPLQMAAKPLQWGTGGGVVSDDRASSTLQRHAKRYDSAPPNDHGQLRRPSRLFLGGLLPGNCGQERSRFILRKFLSRAPHVFRNPKMLHIHLEVAEPGVASAALDTREPTAWPIEDQHNPDPDEIYHWQADAIVCRHLIGLDRPRTIGCHGRPAEPDIVAYDRSAMNQRNVQQVKEQ